MGLFRWLFRRSCRWAFNRVDVNKTGTLDSLEIELAVLHLYNIFNKKLPGWSDPPAREEIQASLQIFDKDKSGELDYEEFVLFADQFLKNGPDMFFARCGKQAMLTTALLPAAGVAVKAMPIPGVAAVPLAVISPIIGSVIAIVRGLIPA